MLNRTRQPSWTFDRYLGYQLKQIAFVKGGKFSSTDVKNGLRDTGYINKLYKRENPKVWWNWDTFNDRFNRHLYRVITHLGGARQKIRNRWVYELSPELFLTHKQGD
tara:strand:- start:6315 stop:6635 length:321 start_codon:yes stop_codon:yes gene_type:complete